MLVDVIDQIKEIVLGVYGIITTIAVIWQRKTVSKWKQTAVYLKAEREGHLAAHSLDTRYSTKPTAKAVKKALVELDLGKYQKNSRKTR